MISLGQQGRAVLVFAIAMVYFGWPPPVTAQNAPAPAPLGDLMLHKIELSGPIERPGQAGSRRLRLKADTLTWHSNGGWTASGNVEMDDGEVLIAAEEMNYDASKKAIRREHRRHQLIFDARSSGHLALR